MKQSKPCIHCESTDFHVVPVNAGGDQGSLLPVGMLHGPRYENRICGQCGHTEWFVSKEHLSLVREKMPKLG